MHLSSIKKVSEMAKVSKLICIGAIGRLVDARKAHLCLSAQGESKNNGSGRQVVVQQCAIGVATMQTRKVKVALMSATCVVGDPGLRGDGLDYRLVIGSDSQKNHHRAFHVLRARRSHSWARRTGSQ